MRPVRRGGIALMALICLAVAGRLNRPAQPVLPAPATSRFPIRPDTPFERLLQQAWKLRSQALRAEIQERDAMENWDPKGSAGLDQSTVQSEALAMDRSGDLRRARRAAQAASALARTPAEKHRVAVLLQLIDRELGRAAGARQAGSRMSSQGERTPLSR